MAKHDNSVLNILYHAKLRLTQGKAQEEQKENTYHAAPKETARQQNREKARTPTISLLECCLWSFQQQSISQTNVRGKFPIMVLVK